MDRIEEPPGTFYLDGCILYYIFRNEWAEEDQSNWDDHCEETYKLEWQFRRYSEIQLGANGVV